MPHSFAFRLRFVIASFLVPCAALAATPAACAQGCTGDLNGDRTVDGADLGTLLGNWGEPGNGDFNGDGTVAGCDLGVMLGAWGACPVTVPAWATLVEAQPDPAVVTDPALRAAIIATGRPWRVRDTATQIEMLLVPPGSFQMGEQVRVEPVHPVTLTNAFYMGRYEVTQAQWQARMGSNPSYWQGANRPVEQVSWNTIEGFCSATGMRLPTEAEWEYAYRAGTTTAFHAMPGYPNGTNEANLARLIAWHYYNTCTGGSGCGTREVGLKAANTFGLHDMAGNVCEWVNDWYGSYSSGAQTDPTGPRLGDYRVLRGGSWGDGAKRVRSSDRYDLYSPGASGINVGFRAARNP
jgi:formylglycine-generating enzyme required for sulfatase activity